MPDLETIRKTLKREMPYLREHYYVETLGIFGSYVRGEETEESDLDVLVTYSRTPDLLEFSSLQIYLEDVLGVKVDLAMKDGLKKYIEPYILREVEYV